MKKLIVYERLPAKETKGCHRYGRVTGDEGIRTIYLEKSSFVGKPPSRLTVIFEGEDG